jgi:response regulator RpfG family c-di-GMP phosphodiesterase
MMLRESLRECGYRVLEAASTDEAIAVLEKTAIPVDVVLSEIDIAGLMNGVGFAQWARSIRPELKILLAGTPERTVRNAAAMRGRADAEEALRPQARAVDAGRGGVKGVISGTISETFRVRQSYLKVP